jgi:hypothetical protein
MIINTMISEILGIILTFILSFAYFYLTELLLILIISPIILLIVTFSPSLSNKTKKFILYFNMFYSLLLSIIYLLLLQIIPNIELLIIINVIIILISIGMIVRYLPIEIPHYEFKKTLNINNNKKFFFIIVVLGTSLISGLFLPSLILKTNSSHYLPTFFLSILLIAAILSYILLFNQKNRKEILYKLSEDNIDIIILWSSILLLSFSKVRESISNIFALHSTLYKVATHIIIGIITFFLMSIMSLYVYVVNTNRNLENMIKWIILAGFLISLLVVYLLIPTIWYISIGLLVFVILLFMYLYIYSCILKNINKKDWNNILGIVLTVYILSSAILYPIIDNVLYAAMIFVFLTIIPLFIYCIIYCHRINKEKAYNKQ